jgi:fatty-acyl-CoA synthase
MALATHNTLADIVRRSAARFPDKVAVIDGPTQLTFAQFAQRCDGAAAALQAAGIGRGDVVLMMARNCWQLPLLAFAAAQIGAVFAPVNYLLSSPEVAQLVELTQPVAVVAEPRFVKTLQQALDRAGLSPADRLVIDATADDIPELWQDGRRWFDFDGQPQPVAVEPEDVVRLMFTSGTEGLPRAVMHSSRSLMSQYLSVIVAGQVESTDIDVHVLPLYHCAQLDVLFTPDFMMGATSVILRSGQPTEILAAIREHQANKFFATPAKWGELLHHRDFDATGLACLTKGYYGASAMPVAVLEELEERLPQLRLWNFYGQTEMAPAATVLPPENQRSHAGSAGRPILAVEVAIVPFGSTTSAGPGVEGEICFRSPQCCHGYYGNEAATAALFRGGWLHSGDVGYLDDNGYLYFVDRLKDTINVGGEKVSSREVEEIIHQLPEIAEVAVIGAPQPRFGEVVVAVVSLQAGANLAEGDIIQFVRQQLAAFKVPRRVVVASESLPRNASGKLLKRVIKQTYLPQLDGDLLRRRPAPTKAV